MLVCLQPLSQYKKKELYRYVETFELADSKLFEDAVITENLSICVLKKNIVDRYTWQDLVLKSVDQRYIEYYKWNVKHNRGLKFKNCINEPSSSFDINLDFIDGTRLCSTGHGRRPGFGNETNGYKWNVLKSGFNDSWRANIACIHFNTKLAKDNFCKYAYSYTYFNNDKSDCLASKTIAGANFAGTSGEMYFAIPQIDWEHISDNPLWKAGNYDNAVLAEMGLKWNADKTVIVKDE